MAKPARRTHDDNPSFCEFWWANGIDSHLCELKSWEINVCEPLLLMSYCLLVSRNNFLSVLIINSDFNTVSVRRFWPQSMGKESYCFCLWSELGRPLWGRGIWAGSWRMMKTLLGEWGDYFSGKEWHEQRLIGEIGLQRVPRDCRSPVSIEDKRRGKDNGGGSKAEKVSWGQVKASLMTY